MSVVKLTGKTYPIRRELRALGGRYDRGAWWVPKERAAEARSLLEVGLARHNARRKRRGTR